MQVGSQALISVFNNAVLNVIWPYLSAETLNQLTYV